MSHAVHRIRIFVGPIARRVVGAVGEGQRGVVAGGFVEQFDVGRVGQLVEGVGERGVVGE
jgi:hypothetical protein